MNAVFKDERDRGAARAARKRKRLTSNRGKLKGDTNKLVKEEEKEEEKMPCNQSA